MLLNVLGGLLMVLAAVLVAARGVRFFWGRGRDSDLDLSIVGRASLGPKQGVAVVEVGAERLVVSYGEGGVRMLHRVEPPRASSRSSAPVVSIDRLEAPASQESLSDVAERRSSRRRRLAGLGIVLFACAAPLSAQDTAPPPAAPTAEAAEAADAALPEAGAPLGPAPEVEPLGPGVLWDLMRAAGVSGSEDEEGLLPGPVGAVLFVGFLTILPTLLLLMTSFTRILVVLNLLRQAVGTQTAPPTHLLIALSLLLTGFVMSPTLDEVNEVALRPWVDGEIDEVQMLTAGSVPFRTFMLSQVREQDLAVFAEMQSPAPTSVEDVSLPVLTSAFVTSELRRAFQIGFALFLPFVVIDVVVASVLMSMGMFMLPPVMVSLPFKLLLFVMVDGWALMLGGLVRSFGA